MYVCYEAAYLLGIPARTVDIHIVCHRSTAALRPCRRWEASLGLSTPFITVTCGREPADLGCLCRGHRPLLPGQGHTGSQRRRHSW